MRLGNSQELLGDVSEAMNGSDYGDDSALQIIIAEEDEHCVKMKSIYQQEYDIIITSAI